MRLGRRNAFGGQGGDNTGRGEERRRLLADGRGFSFSAPSDGDGKDLFCDLRPVLVLEIYDFSYFKINPDLAAVPYQGVSG